MQSHQICPPLCSANMPDAHSPSALNRIARYTTPREAARVAADQPPIMAPAAAQETEEEAAQREAEHEERMAEYRAEQERKEEERKADSERQQGVRSRTSPPRKTPQGTSCHLRAHPRTDSRRVYGNATSLVSAIGGLHRPVQLP